MKGLLVLVGLMISASLSFAHGDGKSSCCKNGAKDAKYTENCTAADKAHCDMTKTGAKQAKMMDCCKDKSKASQAKNTKSKEKTVDAKGTF